MIGKTSGLIFAFFVLTTLLSCNSDGKQPIPRIDIQESFSTLEVIHLLEKANMIIGQKELDSISKIRTGVKILDSLYANVKKNESNQLNIEAQSPLYRTLFLNIDNNYVLQTSAIIGYTTNPILLSKYLNQTKEVYYKNLDWLITGRPQKNVQNLHALKGDKPRMHVDINEIESVISEGNKPTIFQFLSDLNPNSEKRISIKFNQDFRKKIGNRFYTIFFKYDSIEYSAALNPNETICYIGTITQNDFAKMKLTFKEKMQ